MNDTTVINLGTQAIIVTMKVAAPALLAIMAMGFLVSIFQAATQINEQTLSFIPKILAMTIALVFAGPWILQTILFFTRTVFSTIPNITH
ncbi:MAG: flagellar biosynthesis protein FliQ [Deltaproteobacteria bacterium]|nr:flagellar biosynthesis protein FliQ [Deltaproteobacteria bacterium]